MRRWIALGLLPLLGFVLEASLASATSGVVSYRGLLILSDGRLAPDDRYEVDFSIHDAPVGGSTLFVQRRTVHVTRGLYEVHLADAPGAPLLEALAGAERYLQLTIVSGGGLSDVALSPRQQITSAPYALVARTTENMESDPAPLPEGAIVLWDQASGCGGVAGSCPCGFSAASGFDAVTVRGAEVGDTPGVNQGQVGVSDALTLAQLPLHTHDLEDAGPHRHAHDPNAAKALGSPGSELGLDSFGGGWPIEAAQERPALSAGDHNHVVQPAGGGAPHYHPFRTVLFCRKD